MRARARDCENAWHGSRPVVAAARAHAPARGCAAARTGAGTPTTSPGSVFMASSLIYETEQSPPHLAITGTSPTLTSTPGDITATSTDYGLGPSTLQAFLPGNTQPLASVTQGQPCTGAGVGAPQGGMPGSPNSGDRNHRCSAPLSMTIRGEDVPEGFYDMTFKSMDVVTNEASESRPVKVDRTPPEITFSGSLYDQVNQTVSGGPYSVTVKATDGDGAAPLTARSGVRSVQTFIDSEQVDYSSQECPGGSCPMTRTAQFNPSDYPQGAHTVKVIAVDQLGQESARSFTVSTPCCSSVVSSWLSQLSIAASDVAYGDVNGDASADVITRNKVTGVVQVAASDGASSFDAPSQRGTWPITIDLRVADVTGDGNEDLVGRDLLGNVSVGRSDGTSFAAPQVWATTSPLDEYFLADTVGTETGPDKDEADPQDLVGADSAIGPAGAVELITRNRVTGAVSIATPNGTGWDAPEAVTSVDASLPLSFADVDGDGGDDLITTNPATRQIQVRASDAEEAPFAAPTTWGTAPAASEVRFADVDGDDYADMTARDRTTGAVSVFPSKETAFGDPENLGTFPIAHTFELADVNGDGPNDLVGSTSGPVPLDVSALIADITAPLATDPDYTPDPTLRYDTANPNTPETSVPADTSASAAAKTDMSLMWQDDNELARPGVTAEQMNRSIDRIQPAGATIVRFTVLWGRYTADTGGNPNNPTRYDAAIRELARRGIASYVTLTGAHYDTKLPGAATTTNVFTPGPGGFDGSGPVTPANYRTFTESAANHFGALGVKMFSIWNEPNLPSGVFLELRCGDTNKANGRLTSDLYRRLYEQGRAGVIAADTPRNTRIFVGELSEQRQSGRPACSGGRKDIKPLRTREYLTAVVEAESSSLVTGGVAWHPYQHYNTPDSTNTGRTVGIGKIARMQARIDKLNKDGGLKTSADLRPGLYLTEFGYLNRPLSQNPKKSTNIFHTERTRASWYPLALDKARMRHARTFSIYLTAELPSRNVDDVVTNNLIPSPRGSRGGNFDTGVMGTTETGGLGLVDGIRPYGKGPRGARRQNTPQARGAYCSIWRWARDRRASNVYPTQDVPECH